MLLDWTAMARGHALPPDGEAVELEGATYRFNGTVTDLKLGDS